MRPTGKLKITMLAIVGMTMMLASCATVHRHPRAPKPHRHHPHRHKVVIIAEQTAGTEQNTDCITFEECLAMTEPDSYGSTE